MEKGLFFQTIENKINDSVLALHYLDFDSDAIQQIWSGKSNQKVGNIESDQQSNQFLFTVADDKGTAIWYYKSGEKTAGVKISDNDKQKLNGQITGRIEFSFNGQWISFDLQKNNSDFPKSPIAANVDVWSCHDRDYGPELRKRVRAAYSVVPVMLSVQTGILRELESENYKLISPVARITGNYAIVNQQDSVCRFDKTGAKFFPFSFYVLSLKDGKKRFLTKDIKERLYMGIYSFSPNDEWLVYFDSEKRAYFSFNLLNGQLNNISGNISERFISEYSIDHVGPPQPVDDIAGWTDDSKGVLLYDNYDLWNIDPAAHRASINITHGYGTAHQTKLRLMDEDGSTFKKSFLVEILYCLWDLT